MVNFANEAADNLAKKGVKTTVVDLRTSSPLDAETVLEMARETGRVVVVDEAHPRCSIATDISALLADQAFESLKAPIKMVTAPHVPVPFSPALEDLYVPSVAKIEAAAHEVIGYSRAKAAE
jgi:pyruvate dehydrogenase E1 component beta subunit